MQLGQDWKYSITVCKIDNITVINSHGISAASLLSSWHHFTYHSKHVVMQDYDLGLRHDLLKEDNLFLFILITSPGQN